MAQGVRVVQAAVEFRQFARAFGVRRAMRRLAGELLRGRRTPKAIAVHPFDADHGVETSGFLQGWQLPTGHRHDAFSTAYLGTSPSKFKALLDRWREGPDTEPLDSWTFVDVGSGKGRVVMIASTYSFRAVEGIELTPKLARVAEENLRIWNERGRAVCPVRLHCEDAVRAVTDLPAGRLLLYLFNPFEAPVLEALLQALVERRRTKEGCIDVLYLYPVAREVFAGYPQFQLLWETVVERAPGEVPDGVSEERDACACFRFA